MKAERVLNINLGIIGHVDSGKTSLAKVLSGADAAIFSPLSPEQVFLSLPDQGSTASFDKHPQSQERGITLDLGFSVVHLPMPERFKELAFDSFQLTIVDCPGHSSFIRTVIGGAQIIDFMLLVIDATKGVQTQTAEGLVIAELTTNTLVVALNKIDLFPEGENEAAFSKMKQKVAAILGKTKFQKPPMICVSANPKSGSAPIGLDLLTAALVAAAPLPKRDISAKSQFLFSVDHCFSLKGQGTVMTGTVLRGSVAVNDTVEIADLKVEKKVKSMQMFRRPVEVAKQGDRLGICVTQFDSNSLERGIVCFPKSVKTICATLVNVEKIRYFSGEIISGMRFHISIGHRTATGKIFFLLPLEGRDEFEWRQTFEKNSKNSNLALLKLDVSVLCPDDALFIGSKLDADESNPGCRIAFSGKINSFVTEGNNFENTTLKIFKRKEKFAVVERIVSDNEIICKGLFKSYDMNQLIGKKIIRIVDGAVGEIKGNFGSAKNAKFKAYFPAGGFEEKKMEAEEKKEIEGGGEEKKESKRLVFRFKKYLGSTDAKDPKKKFTQ